MQFIVCYRGVLFQKEIFFIQLLILQIFSIPHSWFIFHHFLLSPGWGRAGTTRASQGPSAIITIKCLMLNLYNFKITITPTLIMTSGRWKYMEILERVYLKEDTCISFYSSFALNQKQNVLFLSFFHILHYHSQCQHIENIQMTETILI